MYADITMTDSTFAPKRKKTKLNKSSKEKRTVQRIIIRLCSLDFNKYAERKRSPNARYEIIRASSKRGGALPPEKTSEMSPKDKKASISITRDDIVLKFKTLKADI